MHVKGIGDTFLLKIQGRNVSQTKKGLITGINTQILVLHLTFYTWSPS